MKNKYLHYLFDLIVIIIGITISFWLNNLSETSKNQKEEIRLLESVKSNLITDSLQLFQEQAQFVKAGEYYQKLAESPFKHHLDSLTKWYGYLLVYSSIPTTEIGYTELKAGGLKYLTNARLGANIIKHYSKDNWQWKEYNEIDKTFVINQIIPLVN